MYNTDSSHLSSLPADHYIEEFSGMVQAQYYEHADMRKYLKVHSITNGDTKTDRRIGKAKLQKVTPGVVPKADVTRWGRVSVTVDTVILARSAQFILSEFQSDVNERAELAEQQSEALGEFFDEAVFIKLVKGALQAAPTDVDSIGPGHNVTLTSAGDEVDPDKLEAAISSIIISMQKAELNTKDCVVFVGPDQYRALVQNDKLIDMNFSSGNGDFSSGMVKSIYGSRVVSTNRMPTEPVTGHLLSNARNSDGYDVSEQESRAVVTVLHRDSLLIGETIGITTDLFFDKLSKQNLVDTYYSVGMAVKRPDACGAVFKAA